MDPEHCGLNQQDKNYFEKLGKPLGDVNDEIEKLQGQHRFVDVEDAARLDNANLRQITYDEIINLLTYFDTVVSRQKNIFFIPASGAASRQTQLFKTLNRPEFLVCDSISSLKTQACDILLSFEKIKKERELTDGELSTVKLIKEVFETIDTAWNSGFVNKCFGFISNLEAVMEKRGYDFDTCVEKEDFKTIVSYILDKKNGLGYEFLPKALIPIHAYVEKRGHTTSRTCLEEHIRLWSELFFATKIRFHFTISEEHRCYFEQEILRIRTNKEIQKLFGEKNLEMDKLTVEYSYQAPQTDSIALDIQTKTLARTKEGLPLLRKSGHGALIENLSRLQEVSGIWIQNIDNIPHQEGKKAILAMDLMYKKIMAALATSLQKRAQVYLSQLMKNKTIGADLLEEICGFIKNELTVRICESSTWKSVSKSEKISTLKKILDRPIMVSGFVPLAEGQKGGGPFIIRKKYEDVDVFNSNIVEGAEFEDGQKNTLFTERATHFNPVNFFIAIEKFDGTCYDVKKYVDTDRCFISEKTDFQGKPIKTFEKAGLWNGGLAKVIHLSLCVPSHTFGACKDVAGKESFLSPLHQPGTVPILTDLDRERQSVDEKTKMLLESFQ